MAVVDEIIEFWYSEPMNKHWFNSTPEIDQLVFQNYAELWAQALEGELENWRESAVGCLALILLCDQFPLNMFRGEARSFSTEARAIELALQGIERGYDQQLKHSQLSFFYMPLMHSEVMAHQNLAVEKFEQAGLPDNARFAKHHRSIVERFGRFPHRNEILKRASTPAEIEYLNSPEAFTG
ncbi:MAG TPA: DUF924 domain-containing protein [Gammaproteobacteria bacterium]|nr:DUF924 domain-containing protein [Gammaproteobacteria bacterium]